jgi:hypothetical protein
MEKKMKNLFLLSITASFLFGCAGASPSTSHTVPEIERIENKFFVAAITPTRARTGSNCYDSLQLTITNKTDKNLELIWDQTFFISNERTNGSFWFEGVMYKDKNTPKQVDIVLAQQKFAKVIYPNNLTYLTGRIGMGGNFVPERRHGCLPAGVIGAFVTVRVDEQQIGEKLSFTIGE